MTIEYKTLELKATGDSGEFEGYGAVFGNVDQGNDVIEKGAFKQVETNKDGKLRILFNHDHDKIMGLAEFSQDDYGLHIKGQLNLKDDFTRSKFEHMKSGALDSMSIGYRTVEFTEEIINGDRVRVLKSLMLWEVSVVTFPMNQSALISSAKSMAASINSIRDFEQHLRDIGYSKSQAISIASKGFSVLSDSGQQESRSESELLNELSHLHNQIKEVSL